MKIFEFLKENTTDHKNKLKGLDALKSGDFDDISDGDITNKDSERSKKFKFARDKFEYEKRNTFMVAIFDNENEPIRKTLLKIKLKDIQQTIDLQGMDASPNEIIEAYKKKYENIHKLNPTIYANSLGGSIQIIPIKRDTDIEFADVPQKDGTLKNTLTSISKTPTEQEWLNRVTDINAKRFLNDLESFKGNTFTVDNIVKIFDKYPQNYEPEIDSKYNEPKGNKYKQSQLLKRIVEAFTETYNKQKVKFPLTIVPDIRILKNKYDIRIQNSIAIDFTEILGPIALLTGNVNGNGARVLLQFFGANSVEELVKGGNGKPPAAIYYGTKNTKLYDSFITFNGKTLGISSKGNIATAGASMNGLKKAILEIKRDAIKGSLDKFRSEIFNNSANKNMYDIISTLVEADIDDEDISSNSKTLIKINQLLTVLTKLNLSYTQPKKERDYDAIVAYFNNGNNQYLTGSATSKFFRSKLQDEYGSLDDATEKLTKEKIIDILNAEVVDDLNQNPIFSKICCWLLNHSAIIQLDTKTTEWEYKSDSKSDYDAPKSRVSDSKDNQVPFQILNMIATWPSTVHERVELVKGNANKFYISINGFQSEFGADFDHESSGISDVDFGADWKTKFNKQPEDNITSADDWGTEAGVFSNKSQLNIKTPRGSRILDEPEKHYLGLSPTAMWKITNKYIDYLPKLLDGTLDKQGLENSINQYTGNNSVLTAGIIKQLISAVNTDPAIFYKSTEGGEQKEKNKALDKIASLFRYDRNTLQKVDNILNNKPIDYSSNKGPDSGNLDISTNIIKQIFGLKDRLPRDSELIRRIEIITARNFKQNDINNLLKSLVTLNDNFPSEYKLQLRNEYLNINEGRKPLSPEIKAQREREKQERKLQAYNQSKEQRYQAWSPIVKIVKLLHATMEFKLDPNPITAKKFDIMLNLLQIRNPETSNRLKNLRQKALKVYNPAAHQDNVEQDEQENQIQNQERPIQESYDHIINKILTEIQNSDQFKFLDKPNQAAGCLILAADTGKFLVAKRAPHCDSPDTWCTFGGHAKVGESQSQNALRECQEECGLDPQGLQALIPLHISPAPIRFTTYVAVVPQQFEPTLNDEHTQYSWVEPGWWPTPLHPQFGKMTENDRVARFLLRLVRRYRPKLNR